MSDRHTCYEAIDKALAERGVRLSMCIEFSQETGQTLATPRVLIEAIDDTDKKARKVVRTCNMLASNCPFCGIELERLP